MLEFYISINQQDQMFKQRHLNQARRLRDAAVVISRPVLLRKRSVDREML